MRTVIIRGISEADVETVVGDITSEGATVLAKVKMPDGTYMLIVQVPDAEPSKATADSTKAASMLASVSAESVRPSDLSANFIRYCETFIGRPYVWGAQGPEAYDCSGLVQVLLARVGLDPDDDQTADDLYRWFSASSKGTRVLGKPRLGCLVFFGRPRRIGHVALCLDGETMIEAGGGGPDTTSIAIAQKQNAMVRRVPISRRGDVVAIIEPTGLPW